MTEKTKAFIRLGAMLVLIVNGFLSLSGKSPISNDDVYAYISEIVAVLSSAWAWWKNNNVTEEAQKAQKLLEKMKNE